MKVGNKLAVLREDIPEQGSGAGTGHHWLKLSWCCFPQFWDKMRRAVPMCFSQPWLGAPQQPLASLAWCWSGSAGQQAALLAPRLAGVVSFLVGEESRIHVDDFSVTHRCSGRFSTDGNPSSTVVHLHLGERDHHSPAPAHAEHRSGAGVCWQDAEGWGHQIGAAYHVGGE